MRGSLARGVLLAVFLVAPLAGAIGSEDPALPDVPSVPKLPDPESLEIERFVEEVLDAGEGVSRAPCASLAVGPAQERLDAKTYLGEQTVGVELNGAVPAVEGANAVFVVYPVACKNWVEDLLAHDTQDYGELLAPLLP